MSYLSVFKKFRNQIFKLYLSLNYKNAVFEGEQEKESIIRVRMGLKNLSLTITVCHHSASLVMPIGDPRDGFFYPTLTLMIDSYCTSQHMRFWYKCADLPESLLLTYTKNGCR